MIADPAPYVPLSIAKAASRGSTDLVVKEVARIGVVADGKPWAPPLYRLPLRSRGATGTRPSARPSLPPSKPPCAAAPSMRCSTAPMCYAPISGSPRCRLRCATASDGWSRTSPTPRLAAHALVLEAAHEDPSLAVSARRIGPRPAFERLWSETGRQSETEIEQHRKRYILRNAAPGCAGTVLRTLPSPCRRSFAAPSRRHVKSPADNPAAVVHNARTAPSAALI